MELLRMTDGQSSKPKNFQSKVVIFRKRLRDQSRMPCKRAGMPRIDRGPGYRVYFGRDGKTVVILLAGGEKRSQGADIKKAKEYWQDYEARAKGTAGRRPT